MLATHLVTLFVLGFPLGLIGCYLFAFFAGHMRSSWPMLINVTVLPIESCIFSASANSTAILYVLIVFLRYIQISKAITDARLPEERTGTMRTRNLLSLVLGSVAGFGLSIIGSFQDRPLGLMYGVGVFCWPIFTPLFFCFQANFSYVFENPHTMGFIKVCRVLIIVLIMLTFVVCTILYFYLFTMIVLKGEADHFVPNIDLYLSNNAVGITIILCGWALVICQQLFFATFWPDLEKISLSPNKIECFY